MTPTAETLARSLGAKRNGKGWKALCPAHEDHSPSLDIDIGENGKPLVICRAGCSNDAVIEALKRRGIWPDDHAQYRHEHRHLRDRSKANGEKRPDVDIPTSDPPPLPAHRQFGKPDQEFEYYGANGELIGAICRWNRKRGKEIRPAIFQGGKWVWAGFPKPHPLYRLPDILTQKNKPVLIVEGEKAAEAARELVGTHVVTTWPHGSQAIKQADWSCLSGRDVVLWPDNDEAGRKAMREVANLLTAARPVRGVKLPDGLPKGWDLGDAIPADLDPISLIGRAANVHADRVAALPIKKATAIDAAKHPEIKWAVPGLVPDGCTILAGSKSRGKSFISLDIALAVASGGPALGNITCEQSDVLYLALEDGERRIRDRMRAILQGRDVPDTLDIATEWRNVDDGGLADVEVWIMARPNARLVIVDVLAKIKGKPDGNRGVYDNDYATSGPWHALARRRGIAVILVHHTNKAGAADPVLRISGSQGFSGAVDTTLVLERAAGEQHGTLNVRGRDVPEREIALQFDAETGCVVQLGAADDFRKSEQRRAVIRTLIECGGPMQPVEIAEAIGKKRGTVRMLLSKMHKDGEISKLPNGKYYAT